jgi:hypothetical protein
MFTGKEVQMVKDGQVPGRGVAGKRFHQATAQVTEMKILVLG